MLENVISVQETVGDDDEVSEGLQRRRHVDL